MSLFGKAMPPGEHSQDIFLINTSMQLHYETLAIIVYSSFKRTVFCNCYWFSFEISQCLRFRSFKLPTSSSKLLMPLDPETGFWSVLWMAPSSAPGSTMQSVTRSVWPVTISLQDGGRPLTGLMMKWSAPPTIPDWCRLSTERYCAHCSDMWCFTRTLKIDLSSGYRDL